MDWSDEHYVKLYTRDTATSLLWPWQTVALFPNLLKRCTKVGLVEVRSKDFWAGLAAVTRLPIEVIRPGLEALVEDGTAELVPGGVLLPNFLEAQEAKKTRAAVARDHREKQRALNRGIGKGPKLIEATVTARDRALPGVTADDPPTPTPTPTPALPNPDPCPTPAQKIYRSSNANEIWEELCATFEHHSVPIPELHPRNRNDRIASLLSQLPRRDGRLLDQVLYVALETTESLRSADNPLAYLQTMLKNPRTLQSLVAEVETRSRQHA